MLNAKFPPCNFQHLNFSFQFFIFFRPRARALVVKSISLSQQLFFHIFSVFKQSFYCFKSVYLWRGLRLLRYLILESQHRIVLTIFSFDDNKYTYRPTTYSISVSVYIPWVAIFVYQCKELFFSSLRALHGSDPKGHPV